MKQIPSLRATSTRRIKVSTIGEAVNVKRLVPGSDLERDFPSKQLAISLERAAGVGEQTVTVKSVEASAGSNK